VNILFRILDLAFEADRRHVLLKLRAEVAQERVERVALQAEQARADLQAYEDGLRVREDERRRDRAEADRATAAYERDVAAVESAGRAVR
jgi:hypothetical protein